MKKIDTLEQWSAFSDMLAAAGYRLRPKQIECDGSDNFVVGFMASGRPDLDISTGDSDVFEAMLKYKIGDYERG